MNLPPRKSTHKTLTALVIVAIVASWWVHSRRVQAQRDCGTARVERRNFRQVIRRAGVLKPVNEQHIITKVNGIILEMAPQGKVVAKGEVVLKLDPTMHEDAKAAQEAAIRQAEAEYKSVEQATAKILNQAREDIASYDLRVNLEQMRLAELKKGATPQDIVNADLDLQNAKALLTAKAEECKVLEELADLGYSSKEEVRQKQLDVKEQRLALEQAEIRRRRLDILDPVKLAEQDLKVKDAIKTRDTAKEKATILEKNMQRDAERHVQHQEHERERLKDLIANIEKTVYTAPGPGVIIHRKARWYNFAPGREVWDGQEVITIPDFNKMKVALTVDEARIAHVSVGQTADIRPAGWSGEPFKGKVTMVAEKGHDEFEVFAEETIALAGTANRQVFDVEVEIQGNSPVLRPGLRAEVEVVERSIDNAFVLPRAALFRDKEGRTVIHPAARAPAAKPIKVLAESELTAAVEGLSEGERVWVIDTGQ
ncbi:MAG TPA: HlyD family efflux transporter periplasmic adaptor subunit [Planctomycetota bacterium]|jgi:multidrug resistance efflux pump